MIGVPPSRVDFLLSVEGEDFAECWNRRIQSRYGDTMANWIDFDTLLRIKSGINSPKHQEDARILRETKAERQRNDGKR